MKNFTVTPSDSLKGTSFLPGDKSISHRSVMISSLSEGEVRIGNFLMSEDCLRTVDCMTKLGVEIKKTEDGLSVRGAGLKGLKAPDDILFAGNSGTTIRLLLGILAGQKFKTTITGDDSILKRPMGRVVKPLELMGANIRGRKKGTLAPLTVDKAKLRAVEYELPVPSAQVKSAILLAGLYAEGKTAVVEKVSSRDHTERMLEHFGAKIRYGGGRIELEGGSKLRAEEIDIPSDISSASYLMVAASIIPGSEISLKGVGVNPGRTGIIDVLHRMGADIEVSNERIISGEPIADIRVRASRLKGVGISGAIIPRIIDEIPIIALAASLSEGETVIKGASELRVKESDRIAAVSAELKKLGAKIKELPDGMVINGVAGLKGGSCDSHGDHRVAMMCAVAGLIAGAGVEVKNADCVETSFPGFSGHINSLSCSDSVRTS